MRTTLCLMMPVIVLTVHTEADLPEVLDRVPERAAAVVGVTNMQQFHADIQLLGEVFSEGEFAQPMTMIEMFLATPGLNPGGSAALVVLPGEDGLIDPTGPEPDMFVLLPVSSYDTMIEALGGDVGEEVTTIDMGDEQMFVTNLGGGFCAAAQDRDTLAQAVGIQGRKDTHARLIGTVGQRALAHADLFIEVNIPAFTPAIHASMEEFRGNIEMIAMMAGEQGQGLQQMAALATRLEETLTRDGRFATLALGVDEGGLLLGATCQFREGSDAAGLASVHADAAPLLQRVPDMSYLFATAFDMSAPELKEWMREFTDAMMQMNPGQQQMFGVMDIGEVLDLQNGSAFVMGNPPSLMMGGIFHSALEYKATGDPKKMIEVTRQSLSKLDGVSQGGITFNATCDTASKTIAGVSIDVWSMRMTPDPEVPESAQMGMLLPMIFGPNMGPSGYYAVVDDGLISTFAQNDDLMTRAIEAARTGQGLGSSEMVRSALSNHPNAFAIALIDVGTITRQIMQLAAMMGQQAPFEVPENMAPVSMSLSGADGGLEGRIYLPASLLEMIADIASQYEASMEDAPDDDGAGPRF